MQGLKADVDDSKVIELYLDGKTCNEIGAMLSTDPHRVRNIVVENELDKMIFQARGYTIYQDFKNGMSFHDIAIANRVQYKRATEIVRMYATRTQNLEKANQLIVKDFEKTLSYQRMVERYGVSSECIDRLVELYGSMERILIKRKKAEKERERETVKPMRCLVERFDITTPKVRVIIDHGGVMECIWDMPTEEFRKKYYLHTMYQACIHTASRVTSIYLKGERRKWEYRQNC